MYLKDLGAEEGIGLLRHVMEENARVRDVTMRLKAGENPRLLGPALTASHASLRANYETRMSGGAQATVQAAISAGALGARLTGGPFADWVVILVETSAVAAVRSAVQTATDELGVRVDLVEVVPTPAAKGHKFSPRDPDTDFHP
jgi:galactokinase